VYESYNKYVTNSAYICNTLQFSKTDGHFLIHSECATTVCDRDVSAQMQERASRPKSGRLSGNRQVS